MEGSSNITSRQDLGGQTISCWRKKNRKPQARAVLCCANLGRGIESQIQPLVFVQGTYVRTYVLNSLSAGFRNTCSTSSRRFSVPVPCTLVRLIAEFVPLQFRNDRSTLSERAVPSTGRLITEPPTSCHSIAAILLRKKVRCRGVLWNIVLQRRAAESVSNVAQEEDFP
ncbi:hypothetical protein Mp_7g14860 [Marchantia polymorpha subsp. ruderalis]|uniref:Uncharacterized protein n=2 Tax=Marchantia polymorpha TaxID=3197 RepID=A0AAF6BZP6_MARPO|nr:hypothetical protein MARPO_0009s0171 [Marchantia polymorpha]BBN17480.1 hypothetical protein Mp_7g14860 [Marchantia polymorpha subsp. ruderalis]|eukprot:PTQ47086.1 hypothetical protein MARPO_0009s0171 [Marchantia polymorpha]